MAGALGGSRGPRGSSGHVRQRACGAPRARQLWRPCALTLQRPPPLRPPSIHAIIYGRPFDRKPERPVHAACPCVGVRMAPDGNRVDAAVVSGRAGPKHGVDVSTHT